MKLPSQINIQVICNDERNLGDIIIRMIVHAGSKNPYHIYFPKTNKEGSTSITAGEFSYQFDSHYEIGLMDYNGSIATASQIVTLDLDYQDKLYPSLEIARKSPLLGYERHKWQNSDEIIDYFLSCRNSNFFTDPQSVKIRSNKIIQLVLSKKVY
jgi:hypothetical protein